MSDFKLFFEECRRQRVTEARLELKHALMAFIVAEAGQVTVKDDAARIDERTADELRDRVREAALLAAGILGQAEADLIVEIASRIG